LPCSGAPRRRARRCGRASTTSASTGRGCRGS
jgi:hypothetical protein